MKYKGLQMALVAVALVSVFVAGGWTGCGKKEDQIRAAAKASYRLPGATNDLIAKVTAAREQNLISAETAREFGGWLNKIATAEVVFVQTVKGAEAIYKRTGQVPADQLSLIRTMFDNDIVGPFLKILETFKILSGPAAAMLSAAIAAVRVVLATIGSGFGSSFLGLLSANESPGSVRQAAAFMFRKEGFA